jgi:hypothetical protein
MRQNAGLLLIAADRKLVADLSFFTQSSVGPGRAAALFQLGPRLCCLLCERGGRHRLPGPSHFRVANRDRKGAPSPATADSSIVPSSGRVRSRNKTMAINYGGWCKESNRTAEKKMAPDNGSVRGHHRPLEVTRGFAAASNHRISVPALGQIVTAP